jgi:hypothetical protein
MQAVDALKLKINQNFILYTTVTAYGGAHLWLSLSEQNDNEV